MSTGTLSSPKQPEAESKSKLPSVWGELSTVGWSNRLRFFGKVKRTRANEVEFLSGGSGPGA